MTFYRVSDKFEIVKFHGAFLDFDKTFLIPHIVISFKFCVIHFENRNISNFTLYLQLSTSRRDRFRMYERRLLLSKFSSQKFIYLLPAHSRSRFSSCPRKTSEFA